MHTATKNSAQTIMVTVKTERKPPGQRVSKTRAHRSFSIKSRNARPRCRALWLPEAAMGGVKGARTLGARRGTRTFFGVLRRVAR